MVSLYSITGRFWSRLRYDRNFQLKAAVLLFFLLSMLFGQGDGLIFSFGWISLGLMGFILLYRLQERFFFVTIWMAFVYLLIFIGSMVAFNYAETYGNWFIQIFGYSILIIAFVACFYLILLIKERRDLIALEGEYVPIGFWFIIIMLFYWSSVFSQIGFIRWADGSLGSTHIYRILYIITELIVIPSFILIVTFPEERLKRPHMNERRGTNFIEDLFYDITFKEMRKKFERKTSKEEIITCPRCKLPLTRETRKCPNCGSQRFFYWCDTSQDYLVRCPSCFELTFIGKDSCIHCNSKISSKIRCSKCRDINRIEDWAI